MIKGVNIDITNNPPEPRLLRRWGVQAVRFPSRPDVDGYLVELHSLGIQTLCVVDKKSGGYIAGGGGCSAYQIHNEVDGDEGSASGPLTVEQCREELRIYRATYPGLVLIAPGLSKGDYSAMYLKSIVQVLREERYAAWAIHPYAKSPTAAAKLFSAHRAVDPQFPGIVSECHPEAADIRQFYKSLTDIGAAACFYHCWNDEMTEGTEGITFGLVDDEGKHKQALGFWLWS